MRKTIYRTGLLLLLMLALCLSACAEGGSEASLESWFNSWTDLLFHTRNVTLDGTADFALDGVWFKTAKGHYVQDSMDSLWQLDLSTPRKSGIVQETGFTVIANGDKIFVMEPYTPGVYRSGTDAAQSTVLRESVELTQLTDLAFGLAAQMQPALGDSLSVTENELSLLIDSGNAPPLLNTVLNLVSRFAMKRWYGVDADLIEPSVSEYYGAWITPSQEIMHCTREFTLSSVELKMKREEGKPASAEAKVSFDLLYTNGDRHTLDISFSGSVSSYGSSRVDTFDPEAFGVVPADGSVPADEIPDGAALDSETLAGLMPKAAQINGLAGYDTIPPLLSTWQDGSNIFLEFGTDETGIELETEFGMDEKPISYSWPEALYSSGDGTYDDIPLSEEQCAWIQEKLLAFIAGVDPDTAKRVEKLVPQWYWDSGEEIQVQLVEDPIPDESYYVTFVIRIVDDKIQIIHYSSYSNG